MPTVIHNPIVLPFGPVDIAPEEQSALTLADAPQVLPGVVDSSGWRQGPVEATHGLCEILRSRSELRGSHEHLFLLLYFDQVIEQLHSGATLRSALLPLPNATFSVTGEAFVTADFAFWTGRRFVAVFIRESRFDRHWFREERLLKTWGFEVFQLMAEQLETRGLSGDIGEKILEALRFG